MSNQVSSLDRATARIRRAMRNALTYLFWGGVFYAIFYVAGVWYGSGGTQDPGFASPFGLLWGVSLLVVAAGVLRHLASK